MVRIVARAIRIVTRMGKILAWIINKGTKMIMIVARIVMIVIGMVSIVARMVGTVRKVRILAIMVKKLAGWSRLKG